MSALRPLFRRSPVVGDRSELNALLGDMFSPFAWDRDNWLPTVPAGVPRLNLWEDQEAFMAEAEVPGLHTEDLELAVVGKELTIKGRRRAESQNDATFHRRERAIGEFVRSVTLPVEVAVDQVTASLVNGVLTVKLPKAEAAKPRKIAVQQS